MEKGQARRPVDLRDSGPDSVRPRLCSPRKATALPPESAIRTSKQEARKQATEAGRWGCPRHAVDETSWNSARASSRPCRLQRQYRT
ncbi:hypothetical protein EJB05_32941, partial [Eragrostis curvula]